MTIALQIREVPEEVRDLLAAQAARHGRSLQALLLNLILREANILRNHDMFQRTAHLRVSIPDDLFPERVVREGREDGFEIDRNGEAR